MPDYQLTVIIDTSLVRVNSTDCLVLSRRVNGGFNTAFAVGKLNAGAGGQQQLLHTNTFRWSDRYQVFLVVNYGEQGGAFAWDGSHTSYSFLKAQATTNAVAILPGQMTEFKDHVLLPAVKDPSNSGALVVKNAPPKYRIAVRQETARKGDFRSVIEPFMPDLDGRTEVIVDDECLLFWTADIHTGQPFSKLDVTSSEAYRVSYSTSPSDNTFRGGSDGLGVRYVRYGYAIPDRPGHDEMPGFVELVAAQEADVVDYVEGGTATGSGRDRAVESGSFRRLANE
ncbi:hypothetical protein DFH27DRAFT_608584 [Peziza echinospora]|nr:hypothetical protein DFH27DRAFT_608584 [Peziza echinospora]